MAKRTTDEVRQAIKDGDFELAATTRVTRLRPEIEEILAELGYPEALVTDESRFSDFFDGQDRADDAVSLTAVGMRLGFGETLAFTDYLVDVAERMRGVH